MLGTFFPRQCNGKGIKIPSVKKKKIHWWHVNVPIGLNTCIKRGSFKLKGLLLQISIRNICLGHFVLCRGLLEALSSGTVVLDLFFFCVFFGFSSLRHYDNRHLLLLIFSINLINFYYLLLLLIFNYFE